MLGLGIVFIIIGMGFLYFLLFKFNHLEEHKRKKTITYQKNIFSLYVIIIFTLAGGTIIVIASVAFGLDTPITVKKNIAEFMTYLKIFLPLLGLIGFIYTFFPEKQYLNRLKSRELINETKEKFIHKTRKIGIILLIITFLFSVFFIWLD